MFYIVFTTCCFGLDVPYFVDFQAVSGLFNVILLFVKFFGRLRPILSLSICSGRVWLDLSKRSMFSSPGVVWVI